MNGTNQSSYEERLRRQSLSGSNGQRTPEKRIKMKYSNFIKFLKIYAVVIAVATTLVVGGGKALVNRVQDNIEINQMAWDFHKDCISHETHRTLDNEHYYYDYDDIADYIKENMDFDTGIYMFNINTNDYQTSRVLKYTEYENMEGYLKAHNWEDSDAWRKDMRTKVLTQNELDEKNEELRKMAEEHEIQQKDVVQAAELGGAKE